MPIIKVNAEVFKRVHALSNNGAKVKDICRYVGLSEATVKKIRMSKDLADYKKLIKPQITIRGNTRSVVTDKSFNACKAMLATGISRKDVCSVLGLGTTTVRYIDKCDSLEEYRKYVRDRAKESYKRTNQNNTNVHCVSAYYNENRLYDVLREQNELLKHISAKMAFIVEQLS